MPMIDVFIPMYSNTTRTNSSKIVQLDIAPSHPLEQEILDCVSKIEVLRFISASVSKEEESNVTFCLTLSGKDGRAHNIFFFYLRKSVVVPATEIATLLLSLQRMR